MARHGSETSEKATDERANGIVEELKEVSRKFTYNRTTASTRIDWVNIPSEVSADTAVIATSATAQAKTACVFQA